MNPEIQQLKLEIEELKAQIQALAAFNTIPWTIEKAFANRLGISNLQPKFTDSGLAASTISQAVNESGASSYSVLALPDYVLSAKFENVTVSIPAYDQ